MHFSSISLKRLSFSFLLILSTNAFPQPGSQPHIAMGSNGQITKYSAYDWCVKEAKEGNPDAMFMLGGIYIKGDGIKKDTAEGILWLDKAAKAGNTKAMNNLAVLSQLKKTKADSAKAYLWFLSSAKLGNATAMLNVANAYLRGGEVEKDTAESVKWFAKAAEKENDKAMYWLGYMYDNGKGIKKDSTLSLYWYTKGAEAGNADAQNNLGIKYRKGRWVKKDYDMALKLLKKSADAENIYGMYNLGVMYEYGKGVEQDHKKALKWYKKSAEKSTKSSASYKLGEFYEYGKGGLTIDYLEAIKWYKNGTDKGDMAASAYHIGNMYEFGKGLEKNTDEAMKYYKQSAEGDNGFGMYYVGHLFEKLNIPIVPDQWYRKALTWFENDIAKTLDNTSSMIGLAMMYEQGNGTEKNIAKAKELYQQAADLGDEDAKIKLKEL